MKYLFNLFLKINPRIGAEQCTRSSWGHKKLALLRHVHLGEQRGAGGEGEGGGSRKQKPEDNESKC